MPISNGKEAQGPWNADRDLAGMWAASTPLLISLVCSVALLILFAWLSEEIFEGSAKHFDFAVRAKVHEFFSPALTRFMQAMTFLGSIAFLTSLFVILVAVWLIRGMKRPAAWLAIAVGGSVVLDVALKLDFHRARPVPFVGTAPVTYSFPSGHALSSLCFYGVLAGLLCEWIESAAARWLVSITAAVLILAIGLSRIYLGVHYPTDVIGGYIAAGAWVSALLFVEHAKRQARIRAEQGPLRPQLPV
jgi:undecaprenyl-diphosphatase